MSGKLLTVARAPCKSCPYRRDVPSGVWHADEYDKLPDYDEGGRAAPGLDRIIGRMKVFFCHRQDDRMCAGWVGCHGAENLIALRMAISMGHEVHDDVWTYRSPVPLWPSGHAAAEHGRKRIERPPKDAKAMIKRLAGKLKRRGAAR